MTHDRSERNFATAVAVLIISLIFSIALAFGDEHAASAATQPDNPAANNTAWGP